MARRLLLAILVLSCLVVAAPAPAQTPATRLRVVTFVLPPYAMKQGGALNGFSIDLWNAVAAKMNAGSSFQIASDVDALVADVRSGSADVGVSGVFITEQRDKYVDFSVPILNAGLQVMTHQSDSIRSFTPVRTLASVIFSTTTLGWLAAAILLMLVPAHIIWWLEPVGPEAIVKERRYWPGILDAMTWSMSALLTQAEQLPRRTSSRVVALLWLFCAIMFVALYTADLTAKLTVQQIHGVIDGPDDLPGRTVATLKSSTSASYLRDHDAVVREYASTDAMLGALRDGRVEAVLFSAPSLRYYAAHAGSGKVRLVGPEFNKGDLGFVTAVDSPLRRRINAALLALREDGTYDRIYAKWFGDQ